MGYKHGQAKKGQMTSEYRTWANMIQRCENPNDRAFKDYGGRGIKVCERWQDFRNFYADMGPKPGPEYTLDRTHNNCGYESSNCQWSTWKEQENNKRPISFGPHRQRFFYGHGPNGEMIIENNQSEVARVFGLNQGHISACLRGAQRSLAGWRFQWI